MDFVDSPKCLDEDNDDRKLFDMSDDEVPLVIDDDPFDRELMELAIASTQINNRPDSPAATSKVEITEEVTHVEFPKSPSVEIDKTYSVDLDEEFDSFKKVPQTKYDRSPPSEIDQIEEFEDLVIPKVVGSATSDSKEEHEHIPSSDDEELMYRKQSSVGGSDKEEEAVRSDTSPVSSPEKVGRWTFSGGAAKRPSRASKRFSSVKTAKEKEKFAIHSETQRLIREANVDLLSFKPKEYSSVAEFRKALRGEAAKPSSTDNNTPKEVTSNSKIQSEPESGDKVVKRTVGNLELPESLPSPKPLKANADDIIDLTDEDQPVIPAKGAKVYRLLSTLKKTEAALSASSTVTMQEYSVLRKVANADTGDVVLKMDKVTYKPSSRKPVTFTDRKMWAKHRQELKGIMRAKKLKQYAERMQDYQPAKSASKKSTTDSDEDDEWLEEEEEEDMSDISTESSSDDEGEDDSERDEDDEENPNVSHNKKRFRNPFLDDEAEEAEDGGLLEEPEEFTDLEPSQLGSFKVPLPVEYKVRGEPGEVDLFLGDSTIMGDGSSRSQSQSDSVWNATPYSMLYSQNRVEIHNDPPPVVLSEPTSLSSASTQSQSQSGGGTQPTPTQSTEAPSQTQVVEAPAVEQLPPKPRLQRVRDIAPPPNVSEEVARPPESSYPSYPLQTQVLKPLPLSDSGEDLSSAEYPSQPDSQTQVIPPEGSASTDIFASSFPWETQVERDTQTPVLTEPTEQNADSMDTIPEPDALENDPPVQESDSIPAWMMEGKPKLKRVRDVVSGHTDDFFNVDGPLPVKEDLGQTQVLDPAIASPSELQSTVPEAESSPSISFANSSVVTQIANDMDIDATQPVEPESAPRKSRKRLRHNSDDESDEEADHRLSAFFQPAKRRGSIFEATQPVGVPGLVPPHLLPPVDMDAEEEEAEVFKQVDDADDDYDDDVTGFSSEDDEEKEYLTHIRQESQVTAKKPNKFNVDEFLDEEAELSGDEDELALFRDDRAELEAEVDDESDAGSLKDFVDETELDEERVGKLRREVERVHNRMQEDEDLRNIRYLKERFFEDGDLYDEEGRTRQRRFRWRGLENEDPFAPRNADSDNEEDDDDDKDGAAVAAPSPAATPSGTSWITGGAGLMSRWLLNSASGTAAADGAKTTSTAQPKQEEAKAAPTEATAPEDAAGNGESLVSNLGRKAVFPRRTNSYSGTGVGLKDATIPGLLAKPSSLIPPQTPKRLSLGKRGSLLGRSVSVKKPLKVASEEADAFEANEESNENAEGDASAPATSKRAMSGKIGLSCFSAKTAAGGTPVAVTNRTHFIKTPSMLQPSVDPAVNSKATGVEKRPLRSIFRALN